MVTLDHRIAGIPCQIQVDSYLNVPPFRGSPHLCDSADDYYGYTEIEYTVLDRKGYKAPWLEKKITSEEDEQIEQLIIDYYTEE